MVALQKKTLMKIEEKLIDVVLLTFIVQLDCSIDVPVEHPHH